jgi:hypothetical protein
MPAKTTFYVTISYEFNHLGPPGRQFVLHFVNDGPIDERLFAAMPGSGAAGGWRCCRLTRKLLLSATCRDTCALKKGLVGRRMHGFRIL